MIKDASLTDRQALIILSHLRKKFGNKIITKNIRDALVLRKKVFDEIFDKEDIQFEDKEGNIITRTLGQAFSYRSHFSLTAVTKIWSLTGTS